MRQGSILLAYHRDRIERVEDGEEKNVVFIAGLLCCAGGCVGNDAIGGPTFRGGFGCLSNKQVTKSAEPHDLVISWLVEKLKKTGLSKMYTC